jgi:hypothetical protein
MDRQTARPHRANQTRRSREIFFYGLQEWVIAMDGTVFTALVSGAVALGTVTFTQALTHYFGRKRDHEADWRRLKLEHYKEYVAALSGIVCSSDAAAHRRYRDAANSLNLVAPPKVLIALQAFLDETSVKNRNRTDSKYESLFSQLMRYMRTDCHPRSPNDNPEFVFLTINVPPDATSDSEEQMHSQEK